MSGIVGLRGARAALGFARDSVAQALFDATEPAFRGPGRIRLPIKTPAKMLGDRLFGLRASVSDPPSSTSSSFGLAPSVCRGMEPRNGSSCDTPECRMVGRTLRAETRDMEGWCHFGVRAHPRSETTRTGRTRPDAPDQSHRHGHNRKGHLLSIAFCVFAPHSSARPSLCRRMASDACAHRKALVAACKGRAYFVSSPNSPKPVNSVA